MRTTKTQDALVFYDNQHVMFLAYLNPDFQRVIRHAVGQFHKMNNFLLQSLFGDHGLSQAAVQVLDLLALVVHVRLCCMQLAVEFCIRVWRDSSAVECDVKYCRCSKRRLRGWYFWFISPWFEACSFSLSALTLWRKFCSSSQLLFASCNWAWRGTHTLTCCLCSTFYYWYFNMLQHATSHLNYCSAFFF